MYRPHSGKNLTTQNIADACHEALGFDVAFGQALGMMRPGGTVVLNGVPPGDFSVNIYDLVMRAITLRGSIVGTRHDLARALDLAAQRGIRATVHPAELTSINSILEKMAAWPMPGRVVLEFPTPAS